MKQPYAIPQAWRLHDGEIPTIYLDLAVHLHQLIHYLTAQHPLEVVADQANYGWFDVIDNVSCLCRYSEQIMGQIWFSKAALGHRNGLKIRIYGSDASAEWLQTNPEELLISHADGRRQILDRGETTEVAGADRYSRFKAGHPAGFIEAFANLYQDIANGLTSYQQSSQWHSDEVFSGELALEGTRMFEAMISSFEQRQWVSIAAKPSPSTSRD
ncbi:MAG: Gfo/Idh/MocA family oxidoreductase [Candidatus Thiodiazotropha taylori]